ncbi:MAG: N-acetyltransferase [Bacteroidetes bacterium]|nr:MAG: N-acetyltransferase [Bacteroidota bacterium]
MGTANELTNASHFDFRVLGIEEVKIIASWRYDPNQGFDSNIVMQPYLDNFDQGLPLLGPAACQGFAVYKQEKLAGLFEYYRVDRRMSIGLALNPSLVGIGLGQSFVEEGITFGIRHFNYKGEEVFLNVHPGNLAAIKVYQKVGFQLIDTSEEELKMSLRLAANNP